MSSGNPEEDAFVSGKRQGSDPEKVCPCTEDSGRMLTQRRGKNEQQNNSSFIYDLSIEPT